MKMEYCEFKEMLRAALEKHFEGAAEVSVTTQQKLNHVDKEAITIREKEKEVFKNISLDGLYLAYSVTEDFGRCVEEIISICSEKEIASREDVPMVWDAAKEKVQMRLVKKEWNCKMLENVPYWEYLNFAVVFCVLIVQTEEMNAVVTVNNEMAKEWKVGLDQLWEAAWENLGKEKFSIEDMTTILSKGLGIDLSETGEEECPCSGELYVMSNQSKSYGARAVLRKDMLRNFAKEQKSSFYLLPCSVHEWLLCRDNGELDAKELKRMVCEVNGNPGVIYPEECLSDSVYYYDREQDEVKIIA